MSSPSFAAELSAIYQDIVVGGKMQVDSSHLSALRSLARRLPAYSPLRRTVMASDRLFSKHQLLQSAGRILSSSTVRRGVFREMGVMPVPLLAIEDSPTSSSPREHTKESSPPRVERYEIPLTPFVARTLAKCLIRWPVKVDTDLLEQLTSRKHAADAKKKDVILAIEWHSPSPSSLAENEEKELEKSEEVLDKEDERDDDKHIAQLLDFVIERVALVSSPAAKEKEAVTEEKLLDIQNLADFVPEDSSDALTNETTDDEESSSGTTSPAVYPYDEDGGPIEEFIFTPAPALVKETDEEQKEEEEKEKQVHEEQPVTESIQSEFSTVGCTVLPAEVLEVHEEPEKEEEKDPSISQQESKASVIESFKIKQEVPPSEQLIYTPEAALTQNAEEERAELAPEETFDNTNSFAFGASPPAIEEPAVSEIFIVESLANGGVPLLSDVLEALNDSSAAVEEENSALSQQDESKPLVFEPINIKKEVEQPVVEQPRLTIKAEVQEEVVTPHISIRMERKRSRPSKETSSQATRDRKTENARPKHRRLEEETPLPVPSRSSRRRTSSTAAPADSFPARLRVAKKALLKATMEHEAARDGYEVATDILCDRKVSDVIYTRYCPICALEVVSNGRKHAKDKECSISALFSASRIVCEKRLGVPSTGSGNVAVYFVSGREVVTSENTKESFLGILTMLAEQVQCKKDLAEINLSDFDLLVAVDISDSLDKTKGFIAGVCSASRVYINAESCGFPLSVLYVNNEYRGTGIGGLLGDVSFEIARRSGRCGYFEGPYTSAGLGSFVRLALDRVLRVLADGIEQNKEISLAEIHGRSAICPTLIRATLAACDIRVCPLDTIMLDERTRTFVNGFMEERAVKLAAGTILSLEHSDLLFTPVPPTDGLERTEWATDCTVHPPRFHYMQQKEEEQVAHKDAHAPIPRRRSQVSFLLSEKRKVQADKKKVRQEKMKNDEKKGMVEDGEVKEADIEKKADEEKNAPAEMIPNVEEKETDEVDKTKKSPPNNNRGRKVAHNMFIEGMEVCPFCSDNLIASSGDTVSAASFYSHFIEHHHSVVGSIFACSTCPDAKIRHYANLWAHFKENKCGGRVIFQHDPSNVKSRGRPRSLDVKREPVE